MKLGGFPERIWRSRWLRLPALLLALLLLGTMVRLPPRPPLEGGGDAPLVYTAIPLDGGDPARRDVGRLRFLGGWTMSSPDDRLGGLSGLHVENGEAVAINDIGLLTSFPLPGASPAPRVRFRPLDEGPGGGRRRITRDTEGMTVAGNQIWISFERYNAVWRYDRASLRQQAGTRPDGMRGWQGNSGAESIVRLADGRFLLIEEGRNNGRPTSNALLFAGDPARPGTPAARLIYRRPPGYRATDAALLPDGRVLILNRGLFALRLSARLTVADVRGLRAGSIIEGREVATLEAPAVIENMEGLAVTREGGRTILWLVSDDDFMRMSRHTLLLKFELRL
ncbi:MAG TPA: esterase-like activity of phytase family protein [Allosphingosinicella sp.]|nr:esterase-like activity of phytase family protein [Allosphingosinicella sp.]